MSRIILPYRVRVAGPAAPVSYAWLEGHLDRLLIDRLPYCYLYHDGCLGGRAGEYGARRCQAVILFPPEQRAEILGLVHGLVLLAGPAGEESSLDELVRLARRLSRQVRVVRLPG